MRRTIGTLAAVVGLAAAGCGPDGPPKVTPEMEAEQKRMDEETSDGERQHQKEQRRQEKVKPK